MNAPVTLDAAALWAGIRPDLEFVRIGYPHEAAERVRANREAITPFLLEVLAQFAADPIAVAEDGDYILHFHCICFLSEFREPRAYPLLVAASRLNHDNAEQVFGDFVTEVLGRALASVCDGNTDLLEGLAADPAHGEWIRNAAVVAITTRAIENDLAPAAAAAIIERLGVTEAARLQGLADEARDCTFLSCIVGDLLGLRAITSLPQIRAWFEGDLVDPTFQGDFPGIERQMHADGFDAEQAKAQRWHKGYISDAVRELDAWAMFSPPAPRVPPATPAMQWPADGLPFERSAPKIGRNDPCPCGSGKKFKKCCGG